MIDLVKVKHYIEGKSPLNFKYCDTLMQHYYRDQHVEFWLSCERFSCNICCGHEGDIKSAGYNLMEVCPDDLGFIAQIRLICEMKSDKDRDWETFAR